MKTIADILVNRNSLKPIDQDSVIGFMLDNVAQIKYHNSDVAPHYSEMERWEEKEYKAVKESHVEELREQKKYIIDNEALFNNILTKYNTSVAVFIHVIVNPVI